MDWARAHDAPQIRLSVEGAEGAISLLDFDECRF